MWHDLWPMAAAQDSVLAFAFQCVAKSATGRARYAKHRATLPLIVTYDVCIIGCYGFLVVIETGARYSVYGAAVPA